MGRILVIDDRKLDRQFLATVLIQEGHDILEAVNEKEALHEIGKFTPDQFILDIGILRTDDHDFLKRFQEAPDGRNMQVMFYAAASQEKESTLLVESCNVTPVLIKPSEPGTILAAVNSVSYLLKNPIQFTSRSEAHWIESNYRRVQGNYCGRK